MTDQETPQPAATPAAAPVEPATSGPAPESTPAGPAAATPEPSAPAAPPAEPAPPPLVTAAAPSSPAPEPAAAEPSPVVAPIAAPSASEAQQLAAEIAPSTPPAPTPTPGVPTLLDIEAAAAANLIPASIVATARGYVQDGMAVVDLGDGRKVELQCAFIAEAKLRDLLFQDEVFDPRVSSFDLAQQRLNELEASGKNKGIQGIAWYARVSFAVVRAALERHHPAASDDLVDDVVDALGKEGEPIILCHALYLTWVNVDRLGPYVDRIDPEVTVGQGDAARTYKLRFANRALRMIAEHFTAANREEPTFRDFVEITRAGLARWHALEVHQDAQGQARIIDDVAWRMGLRGVGRMMHGAEQPKRTEAQAEGGSPNAQAGPEGSANGTGTASS